MMKKNTRPNYHNIYNDILRLKYPQKMDDCKVLLKNKDLSVLDIMKINQIIFEKSNSENHTLNQKHKSYNRSDILEILDYQKKNNLNNIQLANHFKISRNTVAKWKKLFLV